MTTDYFWLDLGVDIALAIPLEKTREVLAFRLPSLCAIPGVRPELLGVSNQRGNLLWVIDLPRLLMPSQGRYANPQPLRKTKAVVLAGDDIQAAAIAKDFKGILSFDATELTPTDRPFLSAQAPHSEGTIGILDVDQVFTFFQGSLTPMPAAGGS
ncbi:MAG: CheW domain-containing protein [Synechocystis sp.]|nr:CheW domain-containing protein [Synechocystis sp.]